MSITTPVATKPTKAIVGSAIVAATAIAEGIESLIPDPTVQLICKLATLVLGSVGAAFGIYQTTNAPVNK